MATADTTIARRRPAPAAACAHRRGAALRDRLDRRRSPSLVPILYAVLGGFRDTGQLSTNPVALPDPWVFSNYTGILKSATFWRQVWNSTLIALVSTALTVPLAALAAFVFARFAFRGPRGPVHDLHARAAVPGRGRDPADLHHGPQPGAARQPARRRAAAGRVRAAADDHHPATVLPQHPDRAAGRGGDRRLRPVRASSGGSCCRSRGPCWPRSRCWRIVGSWNAFLLPLVVLTDSEQLDAAAGRDQLLHSSTRPTPRRILAFTTLSMVPALVFYAFAERQLIRGLTTGAVKG